MATKKVVYLVTTNNCSACKCMEYILNDVHKDNPTFTITISDCFNVPDFIKGVITLSDFPAVVFTEDNNVVYHFIGTMPTDEVKSIIKDIGF